MLTSAVAVPINCVYTVLCVDPWSCVYFVITGQQNHEQSPGGHENTGKMLDEGTRCYQDRSVKSTWMNESRRQTADTVRGDGSMHASESVMDEVNKQNIHLFI